MGSAGAVAGRIPLFQQHPFRMLAISKFLSRVAQNALNVALVLLVVDETGLALMSSLLVVALVIPSTAAGMVAGFAADHLAKRPLVVLGNLARAAVCVFFILGPDGVAMFYVIAVLLSGAAQFATNAEGAIQPAIVDRVDMAKANAIGQAISSAAQLAGLAVLAPLILRLFNAPDLLFGVCAALFVVASAYAVLVGPVHSERAPVEAGGAPRAPWWKAGWHALGASPVILQAAVELTLISCGLIVLGGLIPSYIQDVLGLPVDVGAVILLPSAAGVALGLRVSSFLAHRVAHGLLSSVGFTGFVAGLVLLAFVRPEAEFLSGYGLLGWLDSIEIGSFDEAGALAMVIMFPLGFCFALVNVAAQTVLNDRIPLHLQGRAGATQAAVGALAAALPVVVAGALADLVGEEAVMATVAAVLGGLALANSRRSKRAGSYVAA